MLIKLLKEVQQFQQGTFPKMSDIFEKLSKGQYPGYFIHSLC